MTLSSPENQGSNPTIEYWNFLMDSKFVMDLVTLIAKLLVRLLQGRS